MDAAQVVVVGSGVAGATVAAGLLGRGLGPVVMLEAGPRVPMRDQRAWLDHVTTGATPYDGCGDSAGGAAAGWLRGSRLFARGGSTLHWGGWSLRLRPEDFALRTAAGQGADWPLAYADLEPWYGRAEQFLGVAGDSADASQARSAPYPYGPLRYTLVDGEAIRGFDVLGYGYGPMPIARYVAPRDGQSACQTIGTCRYCPIGGRYTADQTLDRLEARGDFELRTGTAATAVVMARRERAAGVAYVEPASGRTGVIEAQAVVLCAGALETPKLLLGSTGPGWEQGVGNAAGHVGRHLVSHPLLYARGAKPSNPLRLQHELDFPTLCSRHFDAPAEQRDGKLFMFLPPVRPRLDLAALMKAGRSRADVAAAVTGPQALELQGFMELFPDPGSRVSAGAAGGAIGLRDTVVSRRDPDAGDAPVARNLARMAGVLAAAGYRDVETGVYPGRGDHAAATCRMSARDADGVVGPDLRVHGVENLWVCSNAVFPSAGAVNPTLTLTALALRLGAGLAAG